RNLHRRVVIGADGTIVRAGLIVARRGYVARDLDRPRAVSTAERNACRRRDADDARDRANALDRGREEQRLRGTVRVLPGRQRDLHCRKIVAVESRIDGAETGETLLHQPRADQEDERDRDLADDERTARPILTDASR